MRTTGKPFNIEKKQVYEAYKAVKSKGGASPPDAYYCIMVRIPMIHRIQACGAMAPMMAGSPRNILERARACPQASIYEALKQKEHAIEISS